MKIIAFLFSFLVLTLSGHSQLSCSGKVSFNFSFTGGVQTWTVPAGITSITIKTQGASGGLASSAVNSAGGGAVIEADYTVVPGQLVTILVGGRGLNGDFESGGGGSTAVYINGVLKMVAGGGGGEDNTGNGGVGVAANDGTNGNPLNASTSCPAQHINDSRGGTAGNGGFAGEFCAANNNGGGGGGGLNSAGGGKTGNYGGGQQGSITGGNGGVAGTGGAAGGWGWSGGGGADDRESGGGGGYAGGGGGGESGFPGGGGSFSDATNRTASFTANGTLTTTAQDGLVTICHLSTLPVNLLSFSGTSHNSYNLLRWKTTDENNLDKFIIERSVDGISYSTAGEVLPVNNANGNTYEFRDNSTGNSVKSFYRLRILDLDRTVKYSSIISIGKNGQSATLNIYPNPVTDNLQISSSSPVRKFEVITVTGKVLLTGNNVNLTRPVSVNTLPKGTYMLKVYTESAVIVRKFIKN